MTSFSDPTPSFTLMDTQGAAIVVTYVVEGEVCVENFEYGAAKPVVPLPPFTQSNSLYSSASGGFVTSGPGEPTSNPEHVVVQSYVTHVTCRSLKVVLSGMLCFESSSTD